MYFGLWFFRNQGHWGHIYVRQIGTSIFVCTTIHLKSSTVYSLYYFSSELPLLLLQYLLRLMTNFQYIILIKFSTRSDQTTSRSALFFNEVLAELILFLTWFLEGRFSTSIPLTSIISIMNFSYILRLFWWVFIYNFLHNAFQFSISWWRYSRINFILIVVLICFLWSSK